MTSEQESVAVHTISDELSKEDLEGRFQCIPVSGVDWELYRAFLSLVHTGNARIAAATIGVSVATLKRRLDRLEQNLHAKLYEGDGAYFKLTRFGVEVFRSIEEANKVLKNCSAFENKSSSNNVSIRTVPGAFNFLLRAFFEEYASEFANINFSLNVDNDFEYSKIQRNDIFICGHAINNNSLESIPAGYRTYKYAYSRDYAKKNGQPIVGELEDHRFILCEPCLRKPETLESTLDLAKRSKSVIRTSTFVHSDLLVRRGVGFGLVFALENTEEFERIDGLPDVKHLVYLNVRKDFIADPKYGEFYETFLKFTRNYFLPG